MPLWSSWDCSSATTTIQAALKGSGTRGSEPAEESGTRLWCCQGRVEELTTVHGQPILHLCQVLNARSTPSLGETDHVEHAPAVLIREKPVRTRRDALQRLFALADGRLNQERTEVYAHPAQGLEGRPRPLVGSLGDHIFISERPAALRARGHELEGVLFRKIVGAGNQEVVADLALLVRLLELRVPLGESRQRLRVLGAQRAVHRLPDRHHGVEEQIVLPERGIYVEGRHRLVERRTDDASLPVQDGEGLRQCILVDLDGVA